MIIPEVNALTHPHVPMGSFMTQKENIQEAIVNF